MLTLFEILVVGAHSVGVSAHSVGVYGCWCSLCEFLDVGAFSVGVKALQETNLEMFRGCTPGIDFIQYLS